MAQENYGSYKCVSRERDYTKVVKNYQLTEQKIPETTTDASNIPHNINDASAAVQQMWIHNVLAIATTGIFGWGVL